MNSDRQLICVSFDSEVASPLENNCTLSRHDSINLPWTLDEGKQENLLFSYRLNYFVIFNLNFLVLFLDTDWQYLLRSKYFVSLIELLGFFSETEKSEFLLHF